MGLLAKLVQRVAPIGLKLGGMIPGPVGMAAKALGPLAAKLGRRAPAIVAAGGAFGVAETLGSRAVGGYRTTAARGAAITTIDDYGRKWRMGKDGKWHPVKKHRAGLSGRDILGAQKVARLVHAFGYKPKIKPRKRGRR